MQKMVKILRAVLEKKPKKHHMDGQTHGRNDVQNEDQTEWGTDMSQFIRSTSKVVGFKKGAQIVVGVRYLMGLNYWIVQVNEK